jgi:hypothetical protein
MLELDARGAVVNHGEQGEGGRDIWHCGALCKLAEC